MKYEEFYSLRLSEVIDFIEVNKQKEDDYLNISFMLFGQVCATIGNFSQTKSKSKKYKAKDFFKINEKKKKQKQSPQQMADILTAICVGLGGEVKSG